MHESWGQAAGDLLGRLGLGESDVSLKSFRDVRNTLRGSGVEIRRVDIVKGTIPVSQGVLGGILGNGKKEFLTFINDNQGAMDLADDRLLTQKDTTSYSTAWVIQEKAVDLDSISPFMRRYKGRFVDLLICALIINLFALVFPLFSSFVYDKILGNNIVETLWALAICLFIVMGIELCVRIVRVNAAERFAVGSETDIDYGVFKKLLDTTATSLPGIASLMERYKQILSYRDFLSSAYLLSLADIPFMLLFLITIAVIGGPMVFIALVGGAAMTIISALMIKPVLDYDTLAKKGSEKRFGLMSDLLSAREVVVGSAFRDDLQGRMRQSSVESALASSKSRYWRNLGGSISNSLSYLSFVAVLVAGVYMVEGHHLTAGGLLAVSMLTSRFMSGISSVSGLLIRYREFRMALRDLNTILPQTSYHAVSPAQGRLKGSISFETVTCALRKKEMPVLDKVSFKITPGEIVGIAGAPGSGKTTLLRLIAGAVDPDEGKILIDDIPVQRVSPDDMSSSFGYKPQDLCLLDGTIESNVRAGRRPLSGEDRQEILELSGLDTAFRDGGLNWETQIGPRGTALSGGQRQLVALARAMLFTPSILLLDEPTNGLDAHLEGYLAQQIGKLRGKSTVMVSTHSHSVLSACDRIIVLGQSRILADGPRDRVLVAKK